MTWPLPTARRLGAAESGPEIFRRMAFNALCSNRNDHPRNHAPQGNLGALHAISITLSYRLAIEFLIDDEEIIPIDIGTHDRVY